MNVTPEGGGMYNITGTVDVTEWSLPGDLTGTYDKATRSAVLTVTNPTPDGCVTMSGSYTLTGPRTGGTLTCSWTNDCGLSGTMSGTVSRGISRIGNFDIPVQPDAPGASRLMTVHRTLLAPTRRTRP